MNSKPGLTLIRPDLDVVDPRDGEIVNVDDITAAIPGTPDDDVFLLHRWAVRMSGALRGLKATLEERIRGMTDPTKGTDRVIRGGYVATVSRRASMSFDAGKLRAIWNDPTLRPVAHKYLRVADVKADLRAVKTIIDAHLDPEDQSPMATFVRALRDARTADSYSVSVAEVEDPDGAPDAHGGAR